MFNDKSSIQARALLLGEHLDLRALETASSLSVAPLVVAAGEHGAAVLFRYGAAVLFNLSALEEVSFLAQLKPLLREAFTEPELEELALQKLNSNHTERHADRVENGVLRLSDFNIARLQIVADVLAKSAVLSHYEGSIAGVFESIEPFADSLRHQSTLSRSARFQDQQLLSHIGNILLIEHPWSAWSKSAKSPKRCGNNPRSNACMRDWKTSLNCANGTPLCSANSR